MRPTTLTELDQYYRDWTHRIPHIPFDPSWDVRAIPPFSGALVRYLVKERDCPLPGISIYLDGNNSLGYGPEPAYWEIYPAADGDTERFAISETAELVEAIRQSLLIYGKS